MTPEVETETPANDAAESRGGRLRGAATSARTKANDAYRAARERTSTAYGSARETASRARSRAADGIDSNPVAALIGGLAIGAIAAAVLPKTRKEAELLGDYGRKLNGKVKEGLSSAREGGVAKLNELGLETAKEKLQSWTSGSKA